MSTEDFVKHTSRYNSPKPSKFGHCSPEDGGTNDNFSDSQIGDVADEEDYKQERSQTHNLQKGLAKEDDTATANQIGRPTANLSGKYTSCTNKNDSLQFQLNHVRV